MTLSLFWVIMGLLLNISLLLMFIQPRFPWKQVVPLCILTWVLASGCVCIAYACCTLTKSVYLLLAVLTWVIFSVLLFYLSQDSLIKNCFSAFSMWNLFFLATFFSMRFSFLLGLPFEGEAVLRSLIYLLISFLFYRFVRPYYRQLLTMPSVQATWFIFVAVSLCFALLFPYYFFVAEGGDVLLMGWFFLLLVVVYMSMFCSVQHMCREYQIGLEAEYVKHKNALLTSALESQKEFISMAKALRHDFKHHNQVLLQLLVSQQYQQATDYLKDYSQQVVDGSLPEYCKNHLANSILCLYANRFAKAGILPQFQIQLGTDLPLSEPDFCSFLSNLLENAYEACIQTEEKFLLLRLEDRSECLICYLENSLNNPPFFLDGLPQSTKPSSGGVGIKIIGELVAHNNGIIQYKIVDNRFITRVVLQHQPSELTI